MFRIAKIYVSSFLLLLTLIRCSSRYHGIQQPSQSCRCSMDVNNVRDACSCGKALAFDVEAPRPEHPDSLKEYGYRVEVPVLEHAREPQNSYHVEVEVPSDPRSPSPGPTYGLMVEIPVTDDPEIRHSYGIDVHEPRRVLAGQNHEYHFQVDRMAVPRKDCCVHDD